MCNFFSVLEEKKNCLKASRINKIVEELKYCEWIKNINVGINL